MKKKSEIVSPMVKKFSHQRHTKEDLGLKFEDLKPMEFLASVWVLNGFGFGRCGFQRAVDLGFGVWVLVAMVFYVSVVLVD
jgi:hypothetical protein